MKKSVRRCHGSFYGKSGKESFVHLMSNSGHPEFPRYNKNLIIKLR